MSRADPDVGTQCSSVATLSSKSVPSPSSQSSVPLASGNSCLSLSPTAHFSCILSRSLAVAYAASAYKHFTSMSPFLNT